jgi:hypothetical protein
VLLGRRVFNEYAQWRGVPATRLRFLEDGERIGDHQTPKMVGLKDGDQIDCVTEQRGGMMHESSARVDFEELRLVPGLAMRAVTVTRAVTRCQRAAKPRAAKTKAAEKADWAATEKAEAEEEAKAKKAAKRRAAPDAGDPDCRRDSKRQKLGASQEEDAGSRHVVDYGTHSVAQLKRACSAKGLCVSGTKAALRARLGATQ